MVQVTGEAIVRTPAERSAVERSGLVALTRGPDRRDNLRRALDLVIDEIDWPTRRRVVVKPNLVTVDRPLSVTHPDALDAVLAAIRLRYDGPLSVAEGAALTPTPEAFAAAGLDRVARAHGADLVDLNTDASVSVRLYDRRGDALVLRMARTLVDSDCRVSLALPKTHDTVLVTLSIKNLAMGGVRNGSLDGTGRGLTRWLPRLERIAAAARLSRVPAWNRLKYRAAAIARLSFDADGRNDKTAVHQGHAITNVNIALLAAIAPPHLAVIDGFEAMEGAGPSDGSAVPWRLACAGTDPVAVDGLIASLMGFPPDGVGYLAYCARLGLGRLLPPPAAIVGGTPPDALRRSFRPHPTHREQMRWRTAEAEALVAAIAAARDA